ncbi:hypothetical protein BU17DRAFT_98598 [Hysterangium stoloniferum]|nr:hypothetical protein BU17DRAFT_98598 [Hysterangium stoloniferum]
MNNNENSTPWSWQHPPLPPSLSLLGSSETRHSNIWYRRFWGVETLTAADIVSTPGQADLILSCKISVPIGDNYRSLDIHAVKWAVKALRFDHPSIASQYAWPDSSTQTSGPLRPGDGRLAYQVPNGQLDIDEWLSQVVIDRRPTLQACNSQLDQAIDLVRRELGKAFPEPRMNTFQLHFIPSPSVSQPHAIVLLMGHTVFDAIATFQVTSLLLSKIAQIVDVKSDMAMHFAWGEEVKRLAKPFPDRGIVSWSSEKIDEDLFMVKRFQEAGGFLKVSFWMPSTILWHLVYAQTAHSLPIPDSDATPSTTGLLTRTVSSTALSHLMKKLRGRQCSMFCVLLATSTITALRINPPKPGLEDITTPFCSPFNLRGKYLSENQNEQSKWQIISALAFAVLFAQDQGRFVHVDLSDKRRLMDDVFTLARELGGQLEDQRHYMPRASFWVDELIHTSLSGGSNPAPPVAIPFVTSLGVMDTNLSATYPIPNQSGAGGAIRISSPLFGVRIPYSPYGMSPVGVHAYTWEGVLHISFSYPEAYMGTVQELQARGRRECGESVLDFIEEFMSILNIIIDGDDKSGD